MSVYIIPAGVFFIAPAAIILYSKRSALYVERIKSCRVVEDRWCVVVSKYRRVGGDSWRREYAFLDVSVYSFIERLSRRNFRWFVFRNDAVMAQGFAVSFLDARRQCEYSVSVYVSYGDD